MLMKITVLAVALPILAAGAPADASLLGVVQDSSHAVVPGALITAFNEDTGTLRSTVSDHQGLYMLTSLQAGRHKILVRKKGFLTAARLGVKLARGSARCDFILEVGPVEQTVTVEGGPSLINTENASVGTSLARRWIDKLPLGGRSLSGLLELVPGVITTPATGGEAGQFSASGQRSNTNYFTVDGVSRNSGVSGAGSPGLFPGATLPSMTAIGSMHNLVSLDAIDEVQVQTSNVIPAFGRMPGAQVAITTRSGSNEFHGSFSASLRNEHMNANDWFANANRLGRPPMRLNQLGSSIGGPIRLDRTYFHLSYERIDLELPYVWRTTAPSVSARAAAPAKLLPLLSAFPLPNGRPLGQDLAELVAATSKPAQVQVGSLRIDHALTSKTSVFGRYSNSPSFSEFGFSQVNRSEFREDSLTFGVAAILTPTMTNDLRVNGTRARVQSHWTSTAAAGAGPLDLSSVAPWVNASFYSLSIGGLGRLMTGDGGVNSQGQINIAETFLLSKGAHNMRFGADYQGLAPRRRGPASSLSVVSPSLPDLLSSPLGWLTQSQSTTVSTRLTAVSLFAHDTWKLKPRLTMSYGVRWEFAPPPDAKAEHGVYSLSGATARQIEFGGQPTPIWRTRFTYFAPRLGVAYGMTRDSRSVLRAGVGIYYDSSLGAATDQINGAPFNMWQIALGTPYSGNPLPSTPRLAYGFADDLRLPKSTQWNVAWQHSWGDQGLSSISYVGSRGNHLLRREALLWPAFNIAQLELATSHGSSVYHGLEVEYRQRPIRGLEGLLSYRWSHSIDTGSWDSSVHLIQPDLTAEHDRASSNFDVRHIFTAALTYDLSLPVGPSFLTQGWAVTGILRARTGFPVNVLAADTFEGLNFANVVRPNLLPGVPVWLRDQNVPGGRRLNPQAFSVSAGHLQGNLGRNAIRGLGMSQLDLALRRSISLSERSSLEIRCEVFNVLNHPNFADPERYAVSPAFGEAASMLNLMLGSGTPHSGLAPALQIGGPRVLQVGLRLRF